MRTEVKTLVSVLVLEVELKLSKVHSRQRAADGGRRTADNEVSLFTT